MLNRLRTVCTCVASHFKPPALSCSTKADFRNDGSASDLAANLAAMNIIPCNKRIRVNDASNLAGKMNYKFANQFDILNNAISSAPSNVSMDCFVSKTRDMTLPSLYHTPTIYELPKNFADVVEISDFNDDKVIGDNADPMNSPIKAHKSDIAWRKRRMKRHRLIRWRKKYKGLVQDQLQRRQKNRDKMQKQDLEKAWRAFGLEEEPPPISREEAIQYIKKWREAGIMVDIVSREEMLGFQKLERIRRKVDKNE